MKKTFIAVLGFAIVAESWAQGLIYFSNWVWNRFSAPVFQPDGRTYAPAGSIYVQLHAGPDANSLAPVGVPVLLGPRDGFYDGGTVTIPSVAPWEMGWFQVQAWAVTATGMDDARARGLWWGSTEVFPSQTSGGPPEYAYPLFSLKSMTLVPEPGAGALLVLGGGLWLLAVRWRSAPAGSFRAEPPGSNP
jgi:hypothetical protein